MVVFQPQPQRPMSSIRFADTEDQTRHHSALSTSPTDQDGGHSEEQLIFSKRPLPVKRSSSNCCCSHQNPANQNCNHQNPDGCANPSSSNKVHFHRSDTIRTPSFSRSDTSTASDSIFSHISTPTSASNPDDPSSTLQFSESHHHHHHHHHDCQSAVEKSPKSLLSAALLQDDLNEGPQIRAAHWNQACGILRKGVEGCSDGKKSESVGEGHQTEAKQEQEVAKKPTAKAHFVEPQRPIRDEKRRVSLPPRIFRPTLSLSPEDETEEGPASLGQPTSTSSFVKRAQSTDASYTGIFSTGNQQNPQQSRGRLVFQEPPLQEKRSGARQASISNSSSQQPSSSNRPPLLSTRSEDEGFRPCLGAHSSRRDVVSDGEVDSNALSGRQSSTSVPHQRQAHISRSQNLQLQSHSRDPSQADSTATPSASRKSTLKFAASPTAASDRRTKSDRLPHIGQLSLHPTRGSGEVRSNISSDDEAYSDQIYLNGGTRFQEPKEKRSGIDHKSSFNDTRISSSPAHARPLSSRERINSRSSSRSSSPPPLSRSVKGKQPLSSRSPAHANLKIRNIMPYTGDAEDEESEDESQDSDEKESEDESEDQESDSEDLDEEEDGPTDDQDDGEEEEEDDDDDDEPLARQTVLSEFNQARLKRNHSLSRSLDDDDDSASILAPSIDSRDLHHPMSFLPSAFEESMEESSSSPHLSFEDVSTSTQMKSFVREQYPYTSPPLSPTSGYGQAGGLGKRRQLSWGLKLPNGKKAGNVEDASNLESTTPGRSGSRPSTPRVMSETTAPKTPRTLSGGFTPNRARCTPSQQVSSVNQEAVARSPPSNGAWSALRNYLEAPSSFNGSPNSTPNAGTGGAFFHLNHLHQQLDQEQEKQDKAWRGSYLRSKSQGSPITRIESSRMGSDSYFNHKESIIRSAPSTPPTSSFLASEQPPPSALDLVRSTNSKPNAQPQRSIKIVSPPIPKERDGLALSNNKKRRPRTAVNEERVGNGSLHFNKQDLLDRFNPRRRRRSGGIIGGKEEMEFGWGRAR